MDRYVDFQQVNREALVYALETYGLADQELHEKLFGAYLKLNCYSEIAETLKHLRSKGLGRAILSNGTLEMLATGVRNTGLDSLLDEIMSVEEVGIFKPDPRVYELVIKHLETKASKILFFSSNAWNIAGASTFGFRCVWVNRFGLKPERLPGIPLMEIQTLDQVFEHLE